MLRAFHVNVPGLLEFFPELVKFRNEARVPAPQGGRYELVIYRTERDGSGDAGEEITVLRTGQFVDVFDPMGTLPEGMTPRMARERNASLVLAY